MELVPVHGNMTERETVADRVHRCICVLNGLFSGTLRSLRLRVISSLMWCTSAVLWLCWFSWSLNRDILQAAERVSLIQIVSALQGILDIVNVLYVRLLFLRKNGEFEFSLQARGRSLRDLGPHMVSIACMAVLNVQKFIAATQHFGRVGSISYFLLSATARSSFLLYNYAMNDILGAQLQLKNAVKSGVRLDSKYIVSQKWKIRKRIRDVNGMFATPLAIYQARVPVTLIYLFWQAVDKGNTNLTKMFLFMFQCTFLNHLFVLSRKSSTLVAGGTGIEVHFMKQVPDQNVLHHVNLLGVLRFREEWDVLQVAGFSLSTPNFLRYVGFCMTCVAVVLQFDYRIVRALNRLSSPPKQ